MKEIVKKSNLILAIGIFISVFVGLTYSYVEFHTNEKIAYTYYSLGMGLFYFLVSLSVFMTDSRNYVKFLFFCLSFNNLVDELFFNTSELSYNEIAFVLIVSVITYFKYYANKTTTTDGGNK